ncbi:MAG: Chromate transport protein [Phycisphaerae bacterium]|nr:Chromate transport protein [Phycisphaerae bacterium]
MQVGHSKADSTPASPLDATADPGPAVARPSFGAALRFWLKLGFVSFGGPTGQIAMMHTEVVERRRWISEGTFLHALNYCMLLPGPEAQQLATYIGWLLHRTWGGVVAGALFVLPSVVILWVLSYVYVSFGQVPWIAAVFDGLKPAVVAIVAAAVLRIGRRVIRNGVMAIIAALAFVAIFGLHVPFPLIILGAAVTGWLGGRLAPRVFAVLKGHGDASASDARGGGELAAAVGAGPTLGRAARVVLLCGALWWLPILLAAALLGSGHAVVRQGVFFSKAAMVTFGGAYAVLPYVAQQAVEKYGWLTSRQMLDGLGFAETTPGPLIMVVQYVGFLGGWHQPGTLPPLVAATLGALISTWATFLPCFLWIFLGAPYIERLRASRRLTAALAAVTAAVVGVVLNLAVWFALQVFWPAPGTVDWFALIVAAGAFAAQVWWRFEVIPIILAAALLGLLRSLVCG